MKKSHTNTLNEKYVRVNAQDEKFVMKMIRYFVIMKLTHLSRWSFIFHINRKNIVSLIEDHVGPAGQAGIYSPFAK